MHTQHVSVFLATHFETNGHFDSNVKLFPVIYYRPMSDDKRKPPNIPAKFGSAVSIRIRVITKLPNSEQSYKGKVKTHNYINGQNQSTTGKL